MKLIDPETNKEYEFEETHFVSSLNGDYQRGTLKPVDSWPKDFYFIEAYGEVASTEKVWHSDGEWENKLAEFGNCFRTKQEAELAADRIKSLQEIKPYSVILSTNEIAPGYHQIQVAIPKKYLKAWEELSK